MGNTLIKVIIDYGFNTLKNETLFAEVFEKNIKAIRLYERFGFKEKKSKQIGSRNIIQMELKNENR